MVISFILLLVWGCFLLKECRCLISEIVFICVRLSLVERYPFYAYHTRLQSNFAQVTNTQNTAMTGLHNTTTTYTSSDMGKQADFLMQQSNIQRYA